MRQLFNVWEIFVLVCKNTLDDCISVPEGKICQEILELYNKEGIVAEPAGAIALAALSIYEENLKEKDRHFIVRRQ